MYEENTSKKNKISSCFIQNTVNRVPTWIFNFGPLRQVLLYLFWATFFLSIFCKKILHSEIKIQISTSLNSIVSTLNFHLVDQGSILYVVDQGSSPFTSTSFYIFLCQFHSLLKFPTVSPLVTQPMMQRRPNPTELTSMDSYIPIICRFQKSKGKVPRPSPLSTKKSPQEDFSHPLGG